MWHGERRKEVMEALNPSKHCTFHCLIHESNLEIINIVKAIDDGKEVDTVDEFDRFI